MRKVLIGILISVVCHALVAMGLFAYLEYGPSVDVVATLDVSSVELSFADVNVESAPVCTALPSAAQPAPPKPKPTEMMPEPMPEPLWEKRLPPDPSDTTFREPPEDPVKMETPRMETPRKEKPEKAQQEEKPASEDQQNAATPSAPAPKQAKLEAPPKPKRSIRPEYPTGSRQRGEQGTVTLEICVGSDGKVSAVRVVTSSGFHELDGAAVRALEKARFTPAKSGGKSVATTTRLTIDFKLK